MTRAHENRCFRRFRQTGDPRLLAEVFDATAPELLRVAGYLSHGDRELTQDALQATFLTAIEQQDRYDDTRDVRPWLLGILANHVRKERRRASRHRDRELADALLPAASPAVEQAESNEFGAVAKRAMQQLPAPFRDVVVLHLQHGLTAAEIGEALQRPAGTVRTQIVRGLDKLRALLPAGFTAVGLGMVLTPGPILAAARQQVLASLPAAAVATSGSSSLFLFLFSWRFVAMMVIGLGVALSLFVFPWPGVDPARPVLEPEATRVETVGRPAVAALDRVPVLGAPAEAAPFAVVEPLQRGGITQKVEFVVDYASDGTPAADVPIAMRIDGVVQQWRTDANGRVEVELPWPGLHEAYVLGTDARSLWRWDEHERRPPVHRIAMTIQPGMALDLRVVDANGRPVPGATVESSHGNQIGTMFLPIGTTDADGRFQRRDLAHGHGSVRAWAPGYVPSSYREATARVGETCTIELRLPKAGLVARGRCVDEAGRPLAGARIALVQQQEHTLFPQFLTSGDDGTFRLDTLHRGVSILVGIHRDADLRRGLVRLRHEGAGEPAVELRLTRGARVTGRLTDAAGLPLQSTNVVARSRPGGVEELPFLETWTRTAADGSFELDALASGRYVLESELVADFAVELRDGDRLVWNPVQQLVEPCRFRVLDARGEPLEGWMVSLMKPGESWPSAGCLLGPDGRQSIVGPGWAFPSGSHYRLAVHKTLGKGDNAWGDHTRMPCLITPPLLVGVDHEIRVPAHVDSLHEIVGEVVDAQGNPVVGAKVTLIGALGQVFPGNADVDPATGAFRFVDYPPGRYRGWVELPGRPTLPLPATNVGGTREHSFGRVVVPTVGAVVAIIPADVDGKGMQIELVDGDGRAFPLRRRADGSWRTGPVFHGKYELRGHTHAARVVPQSVVLSGEEQRVDIEFAPHSATRVIVVVGPDYPRNANSWSGTIRTEVGGRTTSQQRVGTSFYGDYQTRMEFLVPLPPGEQTVRVTCWRNRAGQAPLTVPPGGGGEVTVVLE